MRSVLQDVSHSLRLFARHRALTAIAVLSLAVATGPNAAMFALIDSLFFKPLPVERPDQLTLITARKGARGESLTVPDWIDIGHQSASFDGVIAWERAGLPFSVESSQEMLTANRVSADYFAVLGVKPALGRLLSVELDGPAQSEPAVVISYSYWQRRFGGDPDVVGRTATVVGRSVTIAGVVSAGFRGLDFHFPVDAWLTFDTADRLSRGGGDSHDREHGRLSGVMGRLRAGVTPQQVQTDLDLIGRRLRDAYPDTNTGREFHASSFADDREARGISTSRIFMSAISLVLLVACANVAGLLLALAESRRAEMAVRLSLGAGRWRIVRQCLTESLLLSLGGAVAGLALTTWLLRLPVVSIGTTMLDFSRGIDKTVLLYTAGLALLTSLLFGLVPALRASKVDLLSDLKTAPASGSGGTSRLRLALVAGQVAVAQCLVVCSVLSVRSYNNIQEFSPGFDTSRNILVLTVASEASAGRQAPSTRTALFDGLHSLPGVVEVSTAWSIPLSGSGDGAMRKIAMPGATGDVPVRVNAVGPRYFAAMGIRLLRGRDFDNHDVAGGARTLIVNETLARKLAPDGAVIDRWIPVDGVPSQIVGVVEDGRYRFLREAPEPYAYLPVAAAGLVLIQTSGDPTALGAGVRQAVARMAPGVVVVDMTTLAQNMKFARSADSAIMDLLSALGLVAVFLAAVGVYGVMAHWVGGRTHEFGIRMALGAERPQIVRMVLTRGMRVTVVGATMGLAAAFLGGSAASSWLFGIRPSDPVSYASGAGAILIVAAAACLAPARRASSVEAAAALRHVQ
jgi:predicted permease